MFTVKRLDFDEDDGAQQQKPAAVTPAKSAGQKRKSQHRALSSSSSSSSSDSDAPPPRRAAPAPTPRKKAAASSSSSSSSSASDDDGPSARSAPMPVAPKPFVPVSNVMQEQFGFMLPSGLPPTAAQIAAQETQRKELAAALAAAEAAKKAAPKAAAAPKPAAATPTAPATTTSLRTLSAKEVKKLAPVTKLNAAQAAKLDAAELEAYRQARAAEKQNKKLLRNQQAAADGGKTKDAKADKQAGKETSKAAAATPAAEKKKEAPKPVAPPAPPSQSAATNPLLAGLRKKDESVRAAERAERKRARMEAAGLLEPPAPPTAEETAAREAELAQHKQKLDDMRSARMAAVAERDAKDPLKQAMRGAKPEFSPAGAAATAAPAVAASTSAAAPTAAGPSATAATSAVDSSKPLWMARGRTVNPSSSVSVSDFAFHPAIKATLASQGITRFFATQSEVMPVILKSYGANDVACCAPTGSGKTLAYVLPIVQSLASRVVTRLRCVVLLPSRDLALQVFHVFQPFCTALGLRVELVYGQHSFAAEQARLVGRDPVTGRANSLVDILVCTPGRLMDHLQAAATSTAAADVFAASAAASRPASADAIIDDDDENVYSGVASSSSSSVGPYEFHLHDLQFLVIDEVDRLLNQSYADWSGKLLTNVYAPPTHVDSLRAEQIDDDDAEALSDDSDARMADSQPQPQQHSLSSPGFLRMDPVSDLLQLVERTYRRRMVSAARSSGGLASGGGGAHDYDAGAHVPLQKLLFSATLSNNPAKLASLALVNPLFFTEATSERKKFQIPPTLKQWVLNLPDDAQKPLLLLQLLTQLQQQAAAPKKEKNLLEDDLMADVEAPSKAVVPGKNSAAVSTGFQVLVFTSSVESTHRLYRLLEVFSSSTGVFPFAVAEFSSGLSQQARTKILSRFRRGVLQLIVCSDAMARGMDLSNVDTVINYDVPSYIQTYVHRVGRTARAGAKGSAYTLVKAAQFKAMRNMLHQADNSFYSKLALPAQQDTDKIMPAYQSALAALKSVLQMEKKGEQDAHAPINSDLRSELASAAALQQAPSSAAEVDPSLDADMEDASAKAAAALREQQQVAADEEARMKKAAAAAAAIAEMDGEAVPAEAEGVNFASKHAHKAKRIKLL